jgi:hypothetical protein
MKIKFILITFLFTSSILHSQENEKLDFKNGFKNFKLGTAPSQIKNIIREKNESEITQNPDLKIYNYIGDDIKTIAEITISSISLYFFKDKLKSINIHFGNKYNDFNERQYNNILYYLEQNYGVWYKPTNQNNDITNGAIFKGKKVTLEFFRIEYPKNTNKFRGYINIYDNILQKSLIENQF